jgi:hypothetical protein
MLDSTYKVIQNSKHESCHKMLTLVVFLNSMECTSIYGSTNQH